MACAVRRQQGIHILYCVRYCTVHTCIQPEIKNLSLSCHNGEIMFNNIIIITGTTLKALDVGPSLLL
jgi:hypothetical protein